MIKLVTCSFVLILLTVDVDARLVFDVASVRHAQKELGHLLPATVSRVDRKQHKYVSI